MSRGPGWHGGDNRGSGSFPDDEPRPVMTGDTVRPVAPNQPKTPLKSFRIPETLYRAAQARAAERGESLSEVVRRALEEYSR